MYVYVHFLYEYCFSFLGFGDEYFKESFNSERMNNNKSCLAEYKSVLNSKNTEETLVSIVSNY